ncbi:uncharacterized protein LOC129885079 [Solanum dulcamara]|uniref:uncharacterized protein LOC129885079 n=1 Tax=Solanum dulcamara TaxID=45834 RepID=UPI002485DBDE|nr:uncharacterized protein LOC129885079 [Solanum dulcamara]
MSCPKKESDSSTNSVEDDQIRRAKLQIQFHGIRREDFQTIEAYVKILKSVADSLAEMDSPISDADMVLQLLAGLPTQYFPLKNTISSRCPLPNFEEACSMLHMQEDILLKDPEEKNRTDPGVIGAEQSSSVDKIFYVVDTLGTLLDTGRTVRTVFAVAGTLGLGAVFAGPLSAAVGTVATVGASRMIVFGAVSAVAGWKISQMLPRK